MGRVSSGGHHLPPFAYGSDPRLPHQPGDPLARDTSPLIFQLGMNARAPYLSRWLVKTCQISSVS